MKKVFSNPRYLVAALVLAVSFYSVSVFSSAVGPIRQLLGTFESSFAEKIFLAIKFTLATIKDTPSLDHVLLLAWSLSGAVYLSMLVYYFRSYRSVGSGGGLAGLFMFVLGLGCAACGTLLLTSLGFSLAGSLLLSLPFEGRELSVIGLALILWGIVSLGRAVKRPKTCPI